MAREHEDGTVVVEPDQLIVREEAPPFDPWWQVSVVGRTETAHRDK